MLEYNGKPIKFFYCYDNLLTSKANQLWIDRGYRTISSRNKYCIILKSNEAVKEHLKSTGYQPKPKDKLFFTASSTFPRFKLASSQFKRCIKLDKSNCVVRGNIKLDHIAGYIFEDSLYVYIVPYRVSSGWKTPSHIRDIFRNNPFDFINSNHLYLGEDFKQIYDGEITFSLVTDLNKFVDGTYKNIITDDELDRVINGGLDEIDENTCISILEMLDSSDDSVAGLGLKLLNSYNCNAAPLAVRTMIALRKRLYRLPEWKSVGVQQLLSTVGFQSFIDFPNTFSNCVIRSTDNYTDNDKNLCKFIYKYETQKYLDSLIKKISSSYMSDIAPMSINYAIELL